MKDHWHHLDINHAECAADAKDYYGDSLVRYSVLIRFSPRGKWQASIRQPGGWGQTVLGSYASEDLALVAAKLRLGCDGQQCTAADIDAVRRENRKGATV